MPPIVRAAFLLILVSTVVRADDPPLIAPGQHRAPAEEAKAFRLPPGFTAQLVAAEPDIQKPINMAFDSRGRLWVTCTVEYPFPAKDRPGRDTIKILEDFGPDGRARKITTFADQLNIPIGILPDEDANGAVVFSIPNIWRLRDTDGDGKADSREVLLSGFGTRDTHGMVNGLTRGFDGWVYACHGYLNDSVIQGKDGSRIVMNSGNTFRFRSDGSRVEMVSRGQVNPFGQCIDPEGNHYTACCHSKPITQLMRGAVFTSFSKPHDGLGFGPDMVREYRGSTALCGLAWYDAEHFPDPYHGRMFLGDVVNNCINIFDIERTGATYTAKQHKDDFLSSADPWFRPVDIKLGPDGALYVADFYNRIIGHYEVPLTHPGRDRTSGRIWRIVHTGVDGQSPAAKSPRPDWTKAEVADLIADLNHPNLTVRMLASHQLVARQKDITSDLRKVLNDRLVENGAARTHAAWVLERIGGLTNPALVSYSRIADGRTRIQTMRILAERAALRPDQMELAWYYLEEGRDNLVRKSAAEVLGRHPTQRGLQALLTVRGRPEVLSDSFLLHTIRIAIRDHISDPAIQWADATDEQLDFLCDAALGVPNERAAQLVADHLAMLARRQRERLPEFLHHVARYGSQATTQSLIPTLERYAGKNADYLKLLLGFARGLQERGSLTIPVEVLPLRLIVEHLDSTRSNDALLGIELVATLRQPELYGALAKIAANRDKLEDVRIAAFRALAGVDGSNQVSLLSNRLLDGTESAMLRDKLAESLGSVNTASARAGLQAALPTAPARLVTTIATALAANRDGAAALFDAIETGKVSPRVLLERPVRAKLDALKQQAIQDRIAKMTNGLPSPDAAIQEILKRHAAQIGSQDPANGARVFQKHCATCHQVAGVGTKIGPHLDGIGVRGVERLLEDVLDPNRNVDPAFRTTVIVLKSGVSVGGLVLREDGAVLVLADNQGKEQRVEKSQIESRDVSPLSPMPANWGDQITNRDLGDLIGYLLTLRGK